MSHIVYTCISQSLLTLLYASTMSSISEMLRNLMIRTGNGSFWIFLSARGDRWFNITFRHRCCRGVTLFSCTFHSFINFTTSGFRLSLNLWLPSQAEHSTGTSRDEKHFCNVLVAMKN